MTRSRSGWAERLRREALVVWLAARDPRVPWRAKALALLVAAYALSPIDLVPDFIPVLGLLDDFVLVPAGVWLALRFVPAEILADLRAEAARRSARPISRLGAAAIVALWLAGAALLAWWILGRLS